MVISIRHVKCDETPGECKRCISTGRKCEGYDHNRLPLSHKKNRGVDSLLNGFWVASILPGRTTDERRSFSYFQSRTAPMMNSWFVHDLWDHIFLRLSTAEPSVCHAVIAVGALHEETQDSCDEIPSQNDNLSIHRRFALEQYGRAIAALNSRIGSNDPELKNTALLCCFLFIVIELFLGRCDDACKHLRQGIIILGAYNPGAAMSSRQPKVLRDSEKHISKSLMCSMRHLHDQAVYFGKSNPRALYKAPSITVDHEDPITFDTLAIAFSVRNRLLNSLTEFLAFHESLSSDNIARQWSTLVIWQQHMRALLAQFYRALDRLEEEIRPRGDNDDRSLLKEKQKCTFNLLRLHCDFFSLQTDLCFLWKRGRVEDELYTLRFQGIVEQCEAIAKLGHYHRQPSHLMELGVIQPLYYVCERCADQQIVQRAMKAIENWPHREGLWSSKLAIHMASDIVNS
jgi:Fungal specific transcription factor domain